MNITKESMEKVLFHLMNPFNGTKALKRVLKQISNDQPPVHKGDYYVAPSGPSKPRVKKSIKWGSKR